MTEMTTATSIVDEMLTYMADVAEYEADLNDHLAAARDADIKQGFPDAESWSDSGGWDAAFDAFPGTTPEAPAALRELSTVVGDLEHSGIDLRALARDLRKRVKA